MNQDKQPEALRLADWCDANSAGIYRPAAEAAAELRRLHAESEQHLQELRSYRITVENREARIAELEAQLEKAKASVSGLKKRSDDWKWRALNAEAAKECAPLSDEAVKELIANTFVSVSPMDGLAIARAIEAEHGITQEKQG